MLKNQIDQYNMFLTVENHFEENATLWSEKRTYDGCKNSTFRQNR